jgi:hypothetical protein
LPKEVARGAIAIAWNFYIHFAFAKMGDTRNQLRFLMSNPKESATAIQDAESKSDL